jgi:hypothetical protein
MTPNDELKEILLENQKLLIENNTLLKKLHRGAVRHFWFNIAWIFLFLVLPLIALYKLAMPFYGSFQAPPSTLDDKVQQLNELRGLLE